MLKELIKIANELDRRGLSVEADTLDKLIKKAYSWDKFKSDINSVSTQIGRDIESLYDSGVDKGSVVVEEVAGGVKELGKDLKSLYNLGKDSVETTVGEAKDIVETNVEEATSYLLNNPDVFNTLSIITKIGAAVAIAAPEPSTSAAGIAVLKGASAFDLAAAIGYFSQNRNINGWASIISAIVTVPAGAMYKAYKGLVYMKNSGAMVILRKTAPPSLVGAFIAGLEVIIEIIEESIRSLADEDSEVSKAIRAGLNSSKVKGNMKRSGRELITMLIDIKTDLK